MCPNLDLTHAVFSGKSRRGVEVTGISRKTKFSPCMQEKHHIKSLSGQRPVLALCHRLYLKPQFPSINLRPDKKSLSFIPGGM